MRFFILKGVDQREVSGTIEADFFDCKLEAKIPPDRE